MHAHKRSDRSGEAPLTSFVREADRELLISNLAPSALRGLLIAGALSAPVWVALYLLLR